MSGIQAPDKETMEACRLYVDNLIIYENIM